MTTLNLDLAKKVDAKRTKRLETVKVKYPELFSAGAPPEEHLLELAPYFFDKPQKFYHEPVYEAALAYLKDYYDRHPLDLVSHFQYLAGGWWPGVASTAHYSQIIELPLPPDLGQSTPDGEAHGGPVSRPCRAAATAHRLDAQMAWIRSR